MMTDIKSTGDTDMSVNIIKINDHISLDIFEISFRTRSKRLPVHWENELVYILNEHKAIPEPITSIGFQAAKRGFHVKAKTKSYFIRVHFPTNIPLPYVIRRVIGQDACCARAHTLNENLAQKATDRESEHSIKYGALYALNILPCVECFNKFSSNGYIARVQGNKNPDITMSQESDFNLLTNIVLIWLMRAGNAEKVIDINDTELFESYRINLVKSANRFFTSIAQYCRSVISSVSPNNQSPIVIAAMQELQIIMNSCLSICADINNRPLRSISLDECYGYSEYMARYRQNAQNIAFALRYDGNECQIIHAEEDMPF